MWSARELESVEPACLGFEFDATNNTRFMFRVSLSVKIMSQDLQTERDDIYEHGTRLRLPDQSR
jgi:hypothetical protein